MIVHWGVYSAMASCSFGNSGDTSTQSIPDSLLVVSSVLWVDGNLSIDISVCQLMNFSSLQPKGRICCNSRGVYSVKNYLPL